MTEPKRPARFSSRWLWIIVLAALLVLVILWFANPLGNIEGNPQPMPSADPTEWTTAPATPGVPVTLPETPLRNVPVTPSESPKE